MGHLHASSLRLKAHRMSPGSTWFSCIVGFSCYVLLGCTSRETLQTTTDKANTSSPVPSVTAGSDTNQVRPQDTSISDDRILLQVEATGFELEQGNCRIALYIGPSQFNNPDYAIARAAVPIVDGKAQWLVELDRKELATNPTLSTPLRLAVSAYHDVNENAKLDKSSFGIPTERYGFSNQPKRGFGPPRYEEAAVLFLEGKQTEPQTIQISVF